MIEVLQDSTTLVMPGPELAFADSLKVIQAQLAEVKDIALLTTNNVWMLLSAVLVFMMSLGFACVESGFTQAKNTVNILFKNTIDTCIGIVVFALFGFDHDGHFLSASACWILL